MTEHPSNDQFHGTSFLQGHNAEYVEQLAARYAQDPASVDAAWAEFFRQMNEPAAQAAQAASGPSWARADWPPAPQDDLTSALDGQRAMDEEAAGKKIAKAAKDKGVQLDEAAVRRAVLDSIRALMIIRAYRIRGHLAANLDPLGLADQPEQPELTPAFYGFTDSDLDRPIFLDKVLGLEMASMRQIVDILKKTYCGTFALQYMHISNPEEASWLKERIEGYGKQIQFTKKGRKAI